MLSKNFTSRGFHYVSEGEWCETCGGWTRPGEFCERTNCPTLPEHYRFFFTQPSLWIKSHSKRCQEARRRAQQPAPKVREHTQGELF